MIDVLEKTIRHTKSAIICFPEMKEDCYKEIALPKIYAEKIGETSKYNLHGNCSFQKVLIVDDGYDKGESYKLLAKALIEKGAHEVDLFVKDGIFFKGLKSLKEAGINRIFTAKGEVSEMQGNITYKSL